MYIVREIFRSCARIMIFSMSTSLEDEDTDVKTQISSVSPEKDRRSSPMT